MTTNLGGQNYPTLSTVPRSWTFPLVAVLIPAGTTFNVAPEFTCQVIDCFNNSLGVVTPGSYYEPVIGYEEVFALDISAGLSANPVLQPQFSMTLPTWYNLPSTVLPTGTVVTQITNATLKRYPAFPYFKYTISNPAATAATINGVITLRAC